MREGAWALVVALWPGLVPVRAQDTASIVGTGLDSSGAVVPNAKVIIENPPKGFVQSILSSCARSWRSLPTHKRYC
jgi:hypothetical protein